MRCLRACSAALAPATRCPVARTSASGRADGREDAALQAGYADDQGAEVAVRQLLAAALAWKCLDRVDTVQPAVAQRRGGRLGGELRRGPALLAGGPLVGLRRSGAADSAGSPRHRSDVTLALIARARSSTAHLPPGVEPEKK